MIRRKIVAYFFFNTKKFSLSKFGKTIPEGTQYTQEEFDTISEIEKTFKNYDDAMTKIEIRKATSHLRKIWSIGNEYLQRTQPWVVIKTNETKAAKIVRFGFNLMLFFSEISEPFIPETTIKMKNCLDKSQDQVEWACFKRNFTSPIK